MEKILSIIIPIYNVQNYIEECLKSVLNQKSARKIEAILVDDGSTDKSSIIARKYANDYSDIFNYHRTENRGLSAARNFGLQFVSSEYVTYLDSDDKLKINYFEEIEKIIINHNPDLIFFDFIYLYENKKNNCDFRVLDNESGFINAQTFILSTPCAWNKVIRVKPYRESDLIFPVGIIFEDRALSPCYTNIYKNFYYLNCPLYYYRQRRNSITNHLGYNNKNSDIFKALKFTFERMDGQYYAETEYIAIRSLIFNSSTYYFQYKKHQEIRKIHTFLSKYYPTWRKNQYFRREKLSKRFYAELFYMKLYFLCNLICWSQNKMNRGN